MTQQAKGVTQPQAEVCKIKVSPFVESLRPSPTLAILGLVNELKAAGRTLYDFGVGEVR